MSEKPHRRRFPVSQRIRPPLSSREVIRPSTKKLIKSLNRCNSEPALLGGGTKQDNGGVISQRRDCTDGFLSSPELLFPYSPLKVEVKEIGYFQNLLAFCFYFEIIQHFNQKLKVAQVDFILQYIKYSFMLKDSFNIFSIKIHLIYIN